MRPTLQILGLVFAVLMPLSTQAEDNGPTSAQLGGFHVGLHGLDFNLYAEIPLTAAQQSQQENIVGLYQSQARPLTIQLNTAEDQLRQLMLAPGELNVQDALALEQQVTQLNAKLDDMALDALALMRSHLTNAQLRDVQAAYLQRRAEVLQKLQSNSRN